MRTSRQLLLAGVSGVVLALSAPAGFAADLPLKAPPRAVSPLPSPWTFWIEGGAQGVVGDPFVPLLNPPFDAKPSAWGWDIAALVDYRFQGHWHVSADFRYGANRRHFNTFQSACASTPFTATCFTPLNGNNSASSKESNWVADFMVGRDIGVGSGNAQIKGGLRIAEIRGNTNGSIAWATLFPPPETSHSVYTQSNFFFGVGPRVAIDGNAPLGGPWSVEYAAGIAGLFAHRSSTQFAANGTGFPSCIINCPISYSISDDGFVFNPDATLGIAYALSPTTRISVNYHVDAYFDALRVMNAAGSPTHTYRIYHGPSLRLTWVWP